MVCGLQFIFLPWYETGVMRMVKIMKKKTMLVLDEREKVHAPL